MGGDFYDFFLIDDDHLALVIADVSGKGVPASLFMMSTKILINDHALMGGAPAEILRRVNGLVCANNEADMFVTVWLGILELSTGKLTAANAGHEYPMLKTDGKFEILKIGESNDVTVEDDILTVDEVFANQEQDSISIYSGINLAIFRKGVALTSEALKEKNAGYDPYSDWDMGGHNDIVAYCLLGVGVALIPLGFMTAKIAVTIFHRLEDARSITSAQSIGLRTVGFMGVAMMALGALMMLASLVVKSLRLAKYYNVKFTQIPIMIVDEHDIVSYTTGADGQQKKLINFDQFMYYDVVKCNRQEIGINGSAQGGVEKYKEWGYGDAADINADVGREWLAMYVNRSPAKGNPILASTLTIVTGTKDQPANLDGCLHFFGSSAPAMLDDTAYCYRSDNNGMYMYWATDANAYTASAFNAGYMAIAALGGLAVGIVGTTVAMSAKKKKDPEPAAA